MKQALSLFLLMLCITATAMAQRAGISGTVLDEKNQAIIGAMVQVLQSSIVKGGAATDVNGKYVVKSLAAGTYDVKVSYASYRSKYIKGVKVTANKMTTCNVALELNTKEPEEVVITKYTTPLIDKHEDASKTLTSDQIEKMPTRTTEGLAKTAPGVYQGQNGNLSIAGGRADGTQYIIDGIKVRGKRSAKDNARIVPQSQPIVYQAAPPSNESYKKLAENDFMSVTANPLSTLSVDVDRASYSNVRRFINDGQTPPPDAVRVEEMINYFNYNYPQPKGSDPIAISTEMIDCPWAKGHKLLHVGIQAKEVSTDNLPPSNIVFLVDVSGSMSPENRLPLVKSALKMLTNKLREEDRLSIVVYAGSAGLVLPPTPGNDKRTIFSALDRLSAGGSTAGGAGIQLAYKTAQENFMRGGNNRIVLATDGDFNVGVSSENELENLITSHRDKGIYLTCLGFGMGNYKDSKLELLSDKGNGNYAYIDNIQEAEKTLVKEFGGTIFTIAKDVKAQIEFNPAYVASYRLVGYENRLLNAEDFKDDKKDAGDMGSGHTVTILYELIPAQSKEPIRNVDPLKYQRQSITSENIGYNAELATIKFRYKRPNANKSQEVVHTISPETKRLMHSGENIRFASSVAMFGMLLKNSEYKGVANYDMVLNLARSSKGKDKEGYRAEFIRLVKAVSHTGVNEDEELSTLGWNGQE
jgi:Ca-activated chloride channel family protein